MEQYQLQLERITDKHLSVLTHEDIEIVALRREFVSGYDHAPQRVKVGLTPEEEAKVLEHLSELPGIDVVKDSRREYLYGDSLRSFFGAVGPIAREEIDHYLARGYERNDLVGVSQLEKQYEDVLKGKKGSLENVLDRSGRLVDSPIETPGQRGNDLVLTIDMELQQIVEEILEEEVKMLKEANMFLGNPAGYVMLIEPNTGDILAASGIRANLDNELRNHELGIVHSAFEMGSTVKGATIIMGFETGVSHPGKRIFDHPIKLPQRTDFKSHQNMGWIDDLTALERSSNVYMAEMALNLTGTYNRSQSRWFRSSEYATIKDAQNIAFETLRYYYNQFGLGVETGIDLPSESIGVINRDERNQLIGNIMNFAIGQHDTYTPVQMAQYISTIANGGYRVQPKLVKEIREPINSEEEIGRILKQFHPKILNRIDLKEEQYLERVQEGFRRVVHGNQGTARALASKPYKVAAKTGTAQSYARDFHGNIIRVNGKGTSANNRTLVGYAPYDNPEIAFVVAIPGLRIDTHGTLGLGRSITNIAGKSLDAYFELKETRNGHRIIDVDATDQEELDDEDLVDIE
ncbi:MAG: penicillin-binding protein 2 [Bacillaceae bacterium]|nr:penicillin-binding protein 2 [Bacillaceae bacterium]